MKTVMLLLSACMFSVAEQSFPLPYGGLIVAEENTFHYVWQDTVDLTAVEDSVDYVVVTTPILVIQHIIVHDACGILLAGSDTSTVVEANALDGSCFYLDTANGLRECPIGIDRITVRNPLYPQLAARAGIEGGAYVKAILDTNGTTSNIRLTKSTGNSLMDMSAIDIAEKADYSPALFNDNPVKVLLIIPIGFLLHNHAPDTD